MSNDRDGDQSQVDCSETNIIKEEINLQYHWYMPAFFAIYFLSLIVPAVILTVFIMYLYLPYFLWVNDAVLLFTSLETILVTFSFPFLLIICYLIHIFIVALVTRWFWSITEKKSPSKTGIIPRNIPSRTLNYYHIRSFMIKYPKNAVNRGPFPWLINFLYNFVGTNKIGKGSTIEEQFGADKFVEIGKNCYIGVNSGFSSHAVEGIFGNISYAKIKLGDNVTTAALNCLAPGVEIKDNAALFPIAGATKYSSLKGNAFYYGVPLRKIFKKKVSEYLDISEEQLERVEYLKKQNEINDEPKSGGDLE
jgi:acetyltransferase-like isoleucine patch superfamily enzyme